MYSFKEKQKHYAELRNPDAAEQDLELLRKKQPELSTLSMFSRNPKRYADDILYALLDVAIGVQLSKLKTLMRNNLIRCLRKLIK